jgi:peptidoglycan/xylan/chitin deacetylase (PgdA/CDA1 family)
LIEAKENMGQPVTIVMYHYVRDLKRSRYPAIKGLDLTRFCRQLDYIQAHYTPISADQLLAALGPGAQDLPLNPILLTFDDGYLDHFTNVFPLLEGRNIRGCFFPPAQAILEHKVLDVNKIHFVLASVAATEILLDEVFSYISEFRSEHRLKTREGYLQSVTEEHRYDPRSVTVLKRLLQRELPETVRAEIVRRLFVEHVTTDEAAFACELYMSIEQIACLKSRGMHIGSHGYTHSWLNHISPEAQAVEIDRSLDFLQKLGVRKDDWSICYPYGGFNDALVELLQRRQCRLGFTVEARVAKPGIDDPLTLPRIDTNDLPS